MVGSTNSKSNIEQLKLATWGGGSDEEIVQILEMHYNGQINIKDYWSVGDVRLTSMSSVARYYSTKTNRTIFPGFATQTLELVIIGINHDNLTTEQGVRTKAAITVQTRHCLKITDNNSGYSGDGGGMYDCFASDDIDSTLEEFGNEYVDKSMKKVLAAMPEFITSNVKYVTKYYARAVYYINDKDDGYGIGIYKNTTSKIFLLAYKEIIGSEGDATITPYTTELALSDDKIYQYEYMQTISNRIKYNYYGSETAIPWWSHSASAWTPNNYETHPNYTKTAQVTSTGECIISHGTMIINDNDVDYKYYDNIAGFAPAFCL